MANSKQQLKKVKKAVERRMRKVAQSGALGGGREAKAIMKRRAPVDDGDLKRAIRSGRLKQRKKNTPRATAGPVPRLAPHWHLAEFGTAARVTKDGAARGSAPAQPYIRPAMHRRGEIFDAVREAAAKRLRKAN